jgi:hypothetical protein
VAYGERAFPPIRLSEANHVPETGLFPSTITSPRPLALPSLDRLKLRFFYLPNLKVGILPSFFGTTNKMTNGDGLSFVHYFVAASGNGVMTGAKSDSGDDNMADIPLNGPPSTFGARLALLCVSSGYRSSRRVALSLRSIYAQDPEL